MPTKQTRPSKPDWVYGSEHNFDELALRGDTMSDDQAHRLKALCWQRGERFDETLSTAEAERRIAELEQRG